ncbi:hypothetical protein K3720_20475 (plasmid) [Leisingera caerulea]|uniref:hypothetical protein n=1 Tax=Leisingera caerulea TaxID=506591 RepID=UPI0021A6A633|nr:hypothetical protein [Leisingera caerulea]UWQ52196.1 hypothetical protein K3720_20475 [Leisingera caerulea]
MPAKIFSMEARQDGGARLALNYKHAGRSGIQRLSCDLPQAGLLQLVLFAEALSLRKRFGQLVASDVSIEGLIVSYDPAQRELHVERQAGYSRQTAFVPVEVFQSEMAGMTDICIAQAEASKHGAALKHLLAGCAAPAKLEELLGQDEADLAMHQLREIALLLLAQEASARGSALGRQLRGKKSQEQARQAVSGLVLELAAELVPVSA